MLGHPVVRSPVHDRDGTGISCRGPTAGLPAQQKPLDLVLVGHMREHQRFGGRLQRPVHRRRRGVQGLLLGRAVQGPDRAHHVGEHRLGALEGYVMAQVPRQASHGRGPHGLNAAGPRVDHLFPLELRVPHTDQMGGEIVQGVAVGRELPVDADQWRVDAVGHDHVVTVQVRVEQAVRAARHGGNPPAELRHRVA